MPFLIMRTAPSLKGADKELLENLNHLEFSNFPPLKRRDYPVPAS
ncbi:hypothetical protein [Lichenihabitans psoromatis]|nr:hypothetical protein [Lichenihabitans psoromatis]